MRPSVSKPAGPPIPRPPATRTRAAVMSSVRLTPSSALSSSTPFCMRSASSGSGSLSSCTASGDGAGRESASSLVRGVRTPGRRVTITVFPPGQQSVSFVMPSRLGRAMRTPSSTHSPVQSAARPASSFTARAGARSMPIVVDPRRMRPGFTFLAACSMRAP